MYRTTLRAGILFACTVLTAACMESGPPESEHFFVGGDAPTDRVTGTGLFIANEGNFMYGNASLSYYDPAAKHVENEIFHRANAFDLGDVAQSMTVRNGIGWVAVNNSGVVYAIDIRTFREVGRITGFTSPRHIHFVSDDKAYVTQLWDPRIAIVDPKTYRITGYVETDMTFETGSTEEMVQYGNYVFTNCWSYQNRILVIDTERDEVCDQIVVGIQPASLALDRNGKIWTVTDGGYAGSPYGHEAPALYRIDAATRKIERRFDFAFSDQPSEVRLNGAGDTLYFLNRSVWRMHVEDDRLPAKPFIEGGETRFYALTVNPINSEVYVSDAIDFVQNGVVLRYSPRGEKIDEFYAGITPGAFCWR